jgi:NAD(P)H-dependent flavin oxidoreductase YrpB (nitropropane dioxygenase family)
MTMLRTPLCEALGIEVPIMSAGMSRISLAELVVAVSSAGGLGVLGGALLTPEELRTEIRRVRAATAKPFGVDLLFPRGLPMARRDLEVPPPPEFLAPLARETAALPDPPAPPALTEQHCREQLAVCVEEKVPVLACALGTPAWAVDMAHRSGMTVLALVGSVRQALEVQQAGADYIVAQGTEAGGHTGEISTLVLVPAIVDAVGVPVIAAGGIADGRGLAAALMLGAQGAWLGTRFVATHEARIAPNVRDELVKIGVDGTVRTRAYTGKPARAIRNRFTELWRDNEHLLHPMPVQGIMMRPIVERAQAAGKVDIGGCFAGQAAGLVHEIAGAAQVVSAIAEGAERVLGQYATAERKAPADR